MRVCRICGAEKGLDDFYKHPGMKEGVDTKCKECQKNISRTTRSNNLEYYREYDRNRNVLEKRVSAVNAYKKTENGKIVHRRARTNYANKFPDRIFANHTLTNAVRDGRLFKGEKCSVCEVTAKRIHGHHSDYSKPLSVDWMCSKCHKDWHKHNVPKRIEGF